MFYFIREVTFVTQINILDFRRGGKIKLGSSGIPVMKITCFSLCLLQNYKVLHMEIRTSETYQYNIKYWMKKNSWVEFVTRSIYWYKNKEITLLSLSGRNRSTGKLRAMALNSDGSSFFSFLLLWLFWPFNSYEHLFTCNTQGMIGLPDSRVFLGLKLIHLYVDIHVHTPLSFHSRRMGW